MANDGNDHRSDRLNQIVADYLAAVEASNAPDRDKLLSQHPDLADDLKSLFANHDQRKAADSAGESGSLASV